MTEARKACSSGVNSAAMMNLSNYLSGELGEAGGRRNHSRNFDQRRRVATLRTAMATAFFWPTTTTSFFARVHVARKERRALQHYENFT